MQEDSSIDVGWQDIMRAEDHDDVLDLLDSSGVDITKDLDFEVLEDYILEASSDDVTMETLEQNPDKIIRDENFFKWRIRELARDEWRKNVQQRFNPEFDMLPGYDIELRDTRYHIRGFSHGYRDGGPFEPSEEVLDHVRNAVRHYTESGEVFMEQHLGSLVGVGENHKNFTELNDVDRANKEYSGILNKANSEMEQEVEEFRQMIEDDPELKSRMKEIFEGVLETPKVKALKDPDHLGQALVESRANDLPLDLHSHYEREFDLENYVNQSQRTMYQADEAIQESNSGEVYIVVGLAHAPHMRDYLNSRDGVVLGNYWEDP